jgi:hypothetical protein
MGFLHEKWGEVFGSFVLFIAMGIGIALVPDRYVNLRFYVILLSCFVIVFLWAWWKDGLDIQSWRQVPFVIVQLALAPLAFVGSFAMIGGVIFLALGLLAWDRELGKDGILLLLGGAAPVIAMMVISEIMKTRLITNNR